MRYISVILAMLLAFPAQAETKRGMDRDTLARVEAYLNTLTTVEADFTQIAPDGSVSEGAFFLQRPNKMRWQYSPPSPVTIVTTGSQLVFFDRDLQQVTYVPLESTLAGFLAKPNISFTDPGIKVSGMEAGDGVIRLTLLQAKRPNDGKLTLEFSDAPLQLRTMVIADAQQQVTSVALSDARFGEPIDPGVFVFKDPTLFKKRRR